MCLGRAYFSGKYISLDGALFTFHGIGEYILIRGTTAGGSPIKVTIRQSLMGADIMGTGIDAVGVDVDGNILEIYSGVNNLDIKGSTYYNGVVVGFVNTMMIGEMKYHRKAVNTHMLEIMDELELIVTIQGRSIDVRVQVHPTFNVTGGLLGTCDGIVSNDFTLSSREVLNPDYGGNLDQEAIHGTFGPSWNVDLESSLFSGKPSDEVTSAGTALCFESTAVVSGELMTWSTADVTFDVHFKLSAAQSGCGALLSYRFTESNTERVTTLMICSDFSVVLALDNFQIQTGNLGIQTETWYHLFAVWQPYKKLLVLHIDNQALDLGRVEVISLPDEYSYNIFYPGGTLMLGQWNRPELKTYGMFWNFYGCIDELRIWNTMLSTSVVRDLKFIYSPTSTADLVHYWRFNDGTGEECVDLVNGENLHMTTTEPWRAPLWEKSTSTVEILQSDILSTYTAARSATDERKNQILEFCDFNLNVVNESGKCEEVMGEATSLYFQQQCVFNGLLYDDTAYTMEVLLAYGEQCAYVRKLTTNPAQSLCNNFPTRYYQDVMGELCDVACISGQRSTDGTCKCYSGYAGDSCEIVCPSGNGLPCGAGTCDSTGACVCPPNYEQASNCTECKEGWYGDDCSVAQYSATAEDDTRSCLFYSYSHFINFKRMAFDLNYEAELVLHQSATWEIYIRQIPCGSGGFTCVNQIWFQLNNGQSITVHGIYSNEKVYVVYVDMAETSFGSTLTVHNVELIKYSLSKLQVIHTDGSEVMITAVDRYLNFKLNMPETQCFTSSGICGTCDDNDGKDFEIADGVFVDKDDITTTKLSDAFATYHEITEGTDTAFIYNRTTTEVVETGGEVNDDDYGEEPEEETGCVNSTCKTVTTIESKDVDILSDYLLFVDKCTLESGALLRSFYATSDVTIELKIQPINGDGVLWSYVKNDRVSITNYNKTLALQVNGQSQDLGVSTVDDVWNHLTFVYQRDTGKVLMYNILPNYYTHIRTVTTDSDLFYAGGIFSIGGETAQSGEDSANLLNATFTGKVDEVKIWTTALSFDDILQSYQYDVTGFPNLATYWKFSEGSDYSSYDSVHKYEMGISRADCTTWSVSDVELEKPPVLERDDPYEDNEEFDDNTDVHKNCSTCFDDGSNKNDTQSNSDDDSDNDDDEDKNTSAKDDCKQIFQYSSIADSCDAIGQSMIDSFYYSCLSDTASGSTDAVQLSLLAITDTFVSYCEDVVDLPENSTSDLCANSTSLVDMTFCTEGDGCRFGTFMDGECQCFDGYWGSDCSQICPLGPDNTCGGHGTCNVVTGECECDYSFDVETNCVNCTEGFEGNYCQYSVPPPEPDLFGDTTCGIFGFAVMNNFRNYFRQYRQTARRELYFILPNSEDDYEVQVRMNTCYDSNMCVVAVAVKSATDTVIVRAPYSSSQAANIWHNGNISPEAFTEEGLVTSDFTLARSSQHEYTLSDHKFKLLLKIRVWKQYLNVAALTNSSYCGKVKSVCGCCESNCRPKGLKRLQVPSTKSLFGPMFTGVYGETQNQNGAGFSLKFDNTLISSQPMHHTFFDDKDVTIQFYVRPESLSGVLVSYSYSTTFTVYLDTTVAVQIHNTKHNTPLTLNVNQWYLISVMYRRSSGTIAVHVGSSPTLKHSEYFSTTRTDLFRSGGVLSLGMFTPSWESDVTPQMTTPFLGEMDDVRIWSVGFTDSEIQEAYSAHIDATDENLKAFWKFDEGDGNFVYDSSIDGTAHMWIEQYSWTNPGHIWKFSEAPIPLFIQWKSYKVTDRDIRLKCKNLVYSSTMTPYSSHFTDKRLRSYFVYCMRQYAISNDWQATLMVIMAMADMCYLETSPDKWPGQYLCTEYEETFFPIWRGPDCETECKFGIYDESTDSHCSCK